MAIHVDARRHGSAWHTQPPLLNFSRRSQDVTRRTSWAGVMFSVLLSSFAPLARAWVQ